MTEPSHLQVSVPASPAAVFQAWTESASLMAWLAESADIDLDQRRYDYWGRFTPENPDRELGRHRLEAVEPGSHLHWTWDVQGGSTDVVVTLVPRPDDTLVIVRHSVPTSDAIELPNFDDFWFLSLENLRRHLRGSRDVVRCDFSTVHVGDITHTVVIDGSRDEVFGALIRPEQLNRWIASNASVEPVIGGHYDLGWGQGEAVKILELVPNERLALPGPGDTIITWTLSESGGRTHLTLVHSGFAPDMPTGGYTAGWLNFMSWIKSLVEEGPVWRPAIKALPEAMLAYYPGSIGAAQHELVIPG